MLDYFHRIIATQTNKKRETWKLSVKHCLYDAILEIRFIFLVGLVWSGTSVASDANPESSRPCSCSLPPTSSHFTPTISKHCRLFMLKLILTNCFKQFHFQPPSKKNIGQRSQNRPQCFSMGHQEPARQPHLERNRWTPTFSAAQWTGPDPPRTTRHPHRRCRARRATPTWRKRRGFSRNAFGLSGRWKQAAPMIGKIISEM